MAHVEMSKYVLVATRVPRDLYKRVKLHCVAKGTSIMAFVAGSLESALKKSKKK